MSDDAWISTYHKSRLGNRCKELDRLQGLDDPLRKTTIQIIDQNHQGFYIRIAEQFIEVVPEFSDFKDIRLSGMSCYKVGSVNTIFFFLIAFFGLKIRILAVARLFVSVGTQLGRNRRKKRE
jgi:hypothetical protein